MSRQIVPSRVLEIGFARAAYRVTVEAGTTLADVMESPIFWTSVFKRLRPWDKLEVLWDDGSDYIEFVVTAIGDGRPVLRPLCRIAPIDVVVEPSRGEVESQEIDEQDGVRVEFAGATEKWRTLRIADGVVLKAGLPSRTEARRQRTVYLKTLGLSQAA